MKSSLGCIGLVAALLLAGCSGSGGNTGGGAGGGSGGGSSGGGTGGSGGGTGGSGGGSTNPAPFGALCQQMANGYRLDTIEPYRACNSIATLEEDVAHQGLFSGVGTTPTTFTNEFLWNSFLSCDGGVTDGGSFLAIILQQLEDSVDGGRIFYDPAKAAKCSAASSRDAGLAPECSEVFTPRVLAGNACARTEDCFNDAYCKPAAAGSCGGQCTTRLAIGAACEPTRDVCAGGSCANPDGGYHCQPSSPTDGGVGDKCPQPGVSSTCRNTLRCVQDSVTPLLPDGGPNAACAAPVGDGLACGGPKAPGCASQCSSCYSSDGGSQGVCRPVGGPAAPCKLDQDCLPFHACLQESCVLEPRPTETCKVVGVGTRGNCRWADNYCRASAADAGTGTCTALPTLTQACGTRFDLTPTCATGYCETVAGVGQCKPIPGLDQPCTSTCASGLRCLSADGGSTCRPLPTTGQPCTGTCDSASRCVSNMCVAKFGAGSVCTLDDECLNSNCLPVQKICAEQCENPFGKGITSTGCPNGLRDVSILLGFSAFGLFFAGRRRRFP